MPAPKRIPDAQVRETLTTWRGNVAATARALGISRNGLIKRIETLGVDLVEVRGGTTLAPAGNRPPLAIKTTPPRKHVPVRILPEHQELLRSAKWDLSARWRVDTDEGAVLATFIEEAFPAWLASKLEPRS